MAATPRFTIERLEDRIAPSACYFTCDDDGSNRSGKGSSHKGSSKKSHKGSSKKCKGSSKKHSHKGSSKKCKGSSKKGKSHKGSSKKVVCKPVVKKCK